MRLAIAFIIGLLIGIACRWFKVPVPAPPTLIGALLVLSITVGYIVTDYLMNRNDARVEQLSGGPTGQSIHDQREKQQ